MIIIMIIIACSRRSDRGDIAAFPALPLPFFPPYFFLPLFLRAALYYPKAIQTPGTGYDNNNENNNYNNNDNIYYNNSM